MADQVAALQTQIVSQDPPQPRPPDSDTQACRRCRQQKLRCSKEKPTCRRCQKCNAVCVYPPPPDRKLLASQRLRKAKLRDSQGSKDQGDSLRKSGNDHVNSSTVRTPPPDVGSLDFCQLNHNDAQQYLGNDRRIMSEEIGVSSPATYSLPSRAAMPSPEVAMLLVEIFFTRVYNASLLFHKETFLSDFAANRVPGFVSTSMFALASVFLRKSPSKPSTDDNEVELGISNLALPDLTSYAHQWATAATQEVMMQADEPRLETIQACQILALYWFTRDQKHRTHILTHLAYTISRLLGYHMYCTDDPPKDALDNEIKRRCYWSCWITSCISQENASFKNDSWSGVVGLPFPSDEASFSERNPVLKEAFNGSGNIVLIERSRTGGPNSIMGEFVKLFSLWWDIQHFVRHHNERQPNDSSERIHTLLALDRRLEMIFESLPLDFKYLGPSSFVSSQLDPYKLFSLHCLYRLCGAVLHSSIVPLFSSNQLDSEIPKKYLRMCAEEALRHSKITLNMCSAFLRIRPDKSRLTSLTGYALFVSSSVHFRSLRAQGKLQAYHMNYLRPAISIIGHLKEYWSPLQGLWAQLRSIFASAGLNIEALTVNRSQARHPEQQTDFDRIISHTSKDDGGADIYTYVPDQEMSPPSSKTPDEKLQSNRTMPINSVTSPNVAVNCSGVSGHKFEVQHASCDYIRLVKICANNRLAPFPHHVYSPSHPQSTQGSHLQAPNTFHSPSYVAMNSVLNSVEVDTEAHSQIHVQLASSLSPSESNGDHARPLPNTRHVMGGFEGMTNTMAMDLSNDGESDSWWARTAVGIDMGGGGGLGRDPLEELLDGYVVPNYI